MSITYWLLIVVAVLSVVRGMVHTCDFWRTNYVRREFIRVSVVWLIIGILLTFLFGRDAGVPFMLCGVVQCCCNVLGNRLVHSKVVTLSVMVPCHVQIEQLEALQEKLDTEFGARMVFSQAGQPVLIHVGARHQQAVNAVVTEAFFLPRFESGTTWVTRIGEPLEWPPPGPDGRSMLDVGVVRDHLLRELSKEMKLTGPEISFGRDADGNHCLVNRFNDERRMLVPKEFEGVKILDG